MLTAQIRRGAGCLFITALFLGLPASQVPAGENSYIDEQGEEILLPKDVPVYTLEQPGPWREAAAQHELKIKYRIREEGLEDIRVLKILYPHPMKEGTDEWIKAIYVLEKDGIIVGYQSFSPGAEEAAAEIQINGVINYIEIYAECRKHGLWRTNVKFK